MPHMLPAALSGLSRLQLCSLECLGSSGAARQAFVLPSGPWLGSLRWLSTDIGTLLSSTEALHAASALECLSIARSPEHAAPVSGHSPAAAAFFDWLAHHPPLQRLSIENMDSSKLVALGSFFVQFAQLGRRRPSLNVHCLWYGSGGQMFAEHLCVCYCF